MLPSHITAQEDNASPEDIFFSAITTIFPDDTINLHGTPGSYVTYGSPHLGDFKLHIPQYPDDEQSRQLFAHHLWNGGVVAAEAIERTSLDMNQSILNGRSTEEQIPGSGLTWNQRFWDVRGKNILELGAGTALPSIVCARCNAKSVTITDHPSSTALTRGIIKENVKANLSNPTASSVSIYSYIWGSTSFYEPEESIITMPSSLVKGFDRIILADCLWMPSQHINLIKSVLQFLPHRSSSQPNIASGQAEDSCTNVTVSSQAYALVVAGFHTGRRIVANFISLATNPDEAAATERPEDPQWQYPMADSTQPQVDSAPELSREHAVTPRLGIPVTADSLSEDERDYIGKLKLMEIFEVDVNLKTRPWSTERQGETKWDAKRWCMVAVLARR